MKHLKHKLLTDAQRHAAIERIHNMRVKRLVISTVLIVVGTLLPEFHPHLVGVVVSDSLKTVGFVPLARLFEDVL